MEYEPIARRSASSENSLASEFGLIFEAIADAFRGMSLNSQIEGNWSKLRDGGC